MNQQAELAPVTLQQALLPVLLLLGLSVSAWCCLRAFNRWRQGLPVLPFSPRRRVPWEAIDVVAIVILYILFGGGVKTLVDRLVGHELSQPLDVNASGTAHPIVRMIQDGNAWMLVVGFFSAVIIAPIFEEFLFRVVLQGWLEKAERHARRRLPWLRQILPGIGPIVGASVVFALLHFRTEGPAFRAEYLVAALAGQSIASLLTLAAAIGLLKFRTGATAADLGWNRQMLGEDVRLGLAAFATVAGLIYALLLAVALVVPKSISPDPIPLFFFATVLGTLFYRNHRIVPAVVVHMALNLMSLALLVVVGK